MTSEEELKDAAYRVNRCEAGETLLVVYDTASPGIARVEYRSDCEELARAYLCASHGAVIPAWSDHPTRAGWWAFPPANDGRPSVTVLLSPSDIVHDEPWRRRPCYGPIPDANLRNERT